MLPGSDSCISYTGFRFFHGSRHRRSYIVYVIWKWSSATHDSELEDSIEDSQLYLMILVHQVCVIMILLKTLSGTIQTDSKDCGSDPEDSVEFIPHSLIFKCIGNTKSQDYQTALREARDILSGDGTVTVKLVHEPRNPCDARALAFMCELNGKFHRIGYVVRELLEEVHAARKSFQLNLLGSVM